MRQEGESRRTGGRMPGRPRARAIERLRRENPISASEVFTDLTVAIAVSLAVALLGSLAARLL